MPKGKIQFAKIVASPTDTSWSQVYSAGSLYAVVALTKKNPDDESTLNVFGKGIINNLEAEFFTLETKDLESIKKALENAIESTPNKVHLNIILIFIKEEVAYVYLIGNGEILIQRGDQLGPIITSTNTSKTEKREVLAGSGILKNKDLLLLKTPEFDEIIPKKDLKEAFSTGSADEAAEILSPTIHNNDKGSASAVLISFSTNDDSPPKDLVDEESESPDITQKDTEELNKIDLDKKSDLIPAQAAEEKDDNKPPSEPSGKDFFNPIGSQNPEVYEEKKSFTLPHIPLPRVKKKYLLATSLILLLLLGSILFTTSQKQNAKTQQEFEKVYSEAQKEIEEGESLEELNSEVAQDNFIKAKKLLEENVDKFQEGSTEREQMNELLTKVNKKVSGDTPTAKIEAKEVDPDASPLLELAMDKKATLATKNADSDLFYLTTSKIAHLPSNGEEKEVFKNDEDWTKPVGLGAFGTNVYVLDTVEGLLKFVAGANGYGKSSYFTSGKEPILKSASSMAIDASIYILYKDGEIEKYTRGEKESFSLSGLKKPLKSPTSIITSEEMDNIYVLDIGNSRIVKIDKSGNFKSEYNTPVIKNTSIFDVSEKDNKAYLLSENKVYEISLK